jgi:hypothetical protein
MQDMALLVHDTKQGQLVEAYVVHLLYKQLQVPWQWILLLGSMAQKLVQPLEWLIVKLIWKQEQKCPHQEDIYGPVV